MAGHRVKPPNTLHLPSTLDLVMWNGPRAYSTLGLRVCQILHLDHHLLFLVGLVYVMLFSINGQIPIMINQT